MKKKLSILLALAMTFAGFGFGGGKALAAAGGSVTIASGGGAISADNSVGPVYTALTGPIFMATATGDFAPGTLTLTAPSGFAFKTTAVMVTPSNEVSLGAGSGAAVSVMPTASTITVNIVAGNSSSPGATISFSGIQVAPTAGTPLASGNIVATFSAGSFISPYNVGMLTEVPGAATKLGFTVQPDPNELLNTVFSPSPVVGIQDQFGNVRTGDTATVTLSAVQSGNVNLAASGTLSGVLTGNTSSGLATFNGLSYNVVEYIKLKAVASGLATAYSNTVYISSSAVPPVTNLFNGELVKTASSPTVYMYVNGVLRPFTTPAIFNAHGKKFHNIRVISDSDFAQLSVGKVIGYPAGTMIRGDGPTIYLVTAAGGKQGIPSMAVYNRLRKQLKVQSFIRLRESDLGNYEDEGVAE